MQRSCSSQTSITQPHLHCEKWINKIASQWMQPNFIPCLSFFLSLSLSFFLFLQQILCANTIVLVFQLIEQVEAKQSLFLFLSFFLSLSLSLQLIWSNWVLTIMPRQRKGRRIILFQGNVHAPKIPFGIKISAFIVFQRFIRIPSVNLARMILVLPPCDPCGPLLQKRLCLRLLSGVANV